MASHNKKETIAIHQLPDQPTPTMDGDKLVALGDTSRPWTERKRAFDYIREFYRKQHIDDKGADVIEAYFSNLDGTNNTALLNLFYALRYQYLAPQKKVFAVYYYRTARKNFLESNTERFLAQFCEDALRHFTRIAADDCDVSYHCALGLDDLFYVRGFLHSDEAKVFISLLQDNQLSTPEKIEKLMTLWYSFDRMHSLIQQYRQYAQTFIDGLKPFIKYFIRSQDLYNARQFLSLAKQCNSYLENPDQNLAALNETYHRLYQAFIANAFYDEHFLEKITRHKSFSSLHSNSEDANLNDELSELRNHPEFTKAEPKVNSLVLHAWCQLYGFGCERNIASAVELLERALVPPKTNSRNFKPNRVALFMLGELYLFGNKDQQTVIKPTPIKARTLLERAAELGSEDAKVLRVFMHLHPVYGEVSDENNYDILKRASENGSMLASKIIVTSYLYGKINQIGHDDFILHMRKLRESHDPHAITLYASYLIKEGVTDHPRENAMALCERATALPFLLPYEVQPWITLGDTHLKSPDNDTEKRKKAIACYRKADEITEGDLDNNLTRITRKRIALFLVGSNNPINQLEGLQLLPKLLDSTSLNVTDLAQVSKVLNKVRREIGSREFSSVKQLSDIKRQIVVLSQLILQRTDLIITSLADESLAPLVIQALTDQDIFYPHQITDWIWRLWPTPNDLYRTTNDNNKTTIINILSIILSTCQQFLTEKAFWAASQALQYVRDFCQSMPDSFLSDDEQTQLLQQQINEYDALLMQYIEDLVNNALNNNSQESFYTLYELAESGQLNQEQQQLLWTTANASTLLKSSAQRTLTGLCYQFGMVCDIDYVNARKQYDSARALPFKDSRFSTYALAMMNLHALGSGPDIKRAITLLSEITRDKDFGTFTPAYTSLAQLYLDAQDGKQCRKLDEKSTLWLPSRDRQGLRKKALALALVAIREEDSFAMSIYSQIQLQDGNRSIAAEMIEKAIRLNNHEAMFAYAKAQRAGDEYNSLGIYWLRQATLRGNKNAARAQIWCHQQSDGSFCTMNMAAQLEQQLVDRNDAKATLDRAHKLQSEQPNLAQTLRDKAITLGLPQAYYELAMSPRTQTERKIRLLNRAASLRYVPAMAERGRMAMQPNDHEGPTDYVLAYGLCLLASSDGDHNGMFYFGTVLLNGYGKKDCYNYPGACEQFLRCQLTETSVRTDIVEKLNHMLRVLESFNDITALGFQNGDREIAKVLISYYLALVLEQPKILKPYLKDHAGFIVRTLRDHHTLTPETRCRWLVLLWPTPDSLLTIEDIRGDHWIEWAKLFARIKSETTETYLKAFADYFLFKGNDDERAMNGSLPETGNPEHRKDYLNALRCYHSLQKINPDAQCEREKSIAYFKIGTSYQIAESANLTHQLSALYFLAQGQHTITYIQLARILYSNACDELFQDSWDRFRLVLHCYSLAESQYLQSSDQKHIQTVLTHLCGISIELEHIIPMLTQLREGDTDSDHDEVTIFTALADSYHEDVNPTKVPSLMTDAFQQFLVKVRDLYTAEMKRPQQLREPMPEEVPAPAASNNQTEVREETSVTSPPQASGV